MKYIDKGDSPIEFENWKEQENPKNWDDLPSSMMKEERKEEGVNYYSKAELRTELINEQGAICAYCQDVIENNHTSKIEHIKARGRAEYKNLIFDYNNLVLCCKGIKENPPPKELHCDTNRNTDDLLITPLDANCHTHFRYDENGNIYHNSDEGYDTIIKLNLKARKLINRRKEVIENWLPFEEELTIEDITHIKELMLNKRDDNTYEPFCQVILNILS